MLFVLSDIKKNEHILETVCRCYLTELNIMVNLFRRSFIMSGFYRFMQSAANTAFQVAIMYSSCMFGRGYLMKQAMYSD